ncbi:subtilisin family serine protease [Microbacterium testaceum]|uniref:hypothetical protein n=1 Tax=Microbacterium testaceum TaxID=2033 RepID=UPI00278B2454|nr:hypothetical protein [Microbacterium testaceum]MDQ1112124.1 subtilisin family serine protease [Microbacterium testaceum]
MTGNTLPRNRWVRGVTAVAVSAALALAPSLAASAAPEDNWWYDAYGMAAIHTEGWTGAGAKIAVIDANINPNLPVFEGRNLVVDPRPLCAESSSSTTTDPTEDAIHGTHRRCADHRERHRARWSARYCTGCSCHVLQLWH